jgi:endonuclease-3
LLPVDTHVHRVSQRTGLIGPKVDPTAAHARLMALLPRDPHVLYNLRTALLTHGRKGCVWGRPRCEKCPATEICDWYRANRSTEGREGRSEA